MSLGYDGKLYILAFDHRGSFQKKMFGIEGDPTPEQTETIADAKHLIFEGMQKAVERGVDAAATGTLVDEQFGGDIPAQAKAARAQAGDAGREERARTSSTSSTTTTSAQHILRLRPPLLQGARPLQPRRRRRDERAPERAPQAARRLAPRERPQVPLRAAGARRGPPARAGGRRHRPLRRRAAPGPDAPRDRGDPGLRHRGGHLEDRGRRRAARTPRCSPAPPAATAATAWSACCWAAARATRRWTTGCARRRPSRASWASRSAARSGGTPSRASSTDRLEREDAAEQIADNYLRFVEVYKSAEGAAGALQ